MTNLSDEAALYLRRRYAAVHTLLDEIDFDRDALFSHLSTPFRGAGKHDMVVAFENTDADELVAEFLDYLPRGDVPLFCYWLDKKLIKIPRYVLTAYAFEGYLEHHGYHIDALIVVRQTLDPEAVSAMVHRAVDRVLPERVWVISLLATDEAEKRLLEMLPGPTATKVRFHRFQTGEYGDDLFRRTTDVQSGGAPNDDEGPAIRQIDRKFFMPKLIEDRMRPRPEPEDGSTPDPFALQ